MSSRRQQQGTALKNSSGYMLTDNSFDFTLTDDIENFILIKSSAHLVQKPTTVVTADNEMRSMWMFSECLCVLSVMLFLDHKPSIRKADTAVSCSFFMFLTLLYIVIHYTPNVALRLCSYCIVCHTL